MKYELLKRTAIALFVGGVISTYAMAEDKPIEAAGNSFIKAIDAEITKQTEAVKTELTNSIAEKADKSAVDDINAELDARAKALKTLQEEKASVKDLNAISENVKEGFNSIQDKVHNLQEALAGDGTEEKPGLIKSVSSAVEELNDNIAKKANQADVEANKAEIAKFGAQTNSNAALLLTMAGKVDQNKKDTDEAIAKNASAIVNIRNKQVLQNARLDNHGERIEANEAAIGELAKATDESVKNLGNAVNDLDENLAGTQEAVAENRKDIDANAVAIDKLKETQTYKDLSKVETLVKDKADKTAVEKNASRITDTRNKQVLQNARLDNHGERIEANKAAIGDLATVIDEAVTNLDGVVNDLHGDLSVTKHTVAENRKDIDKNASRITNTRNKQVLQNARLDNHSNRIATNKSDIATNKADITTNKADITTNKADIATNKADITTNKADITTNKADIATNKADIATNKADIADSKANIITNRANITANTAAIATHNQRLDHLDNRVNKLDKDLKRGLATQAALTGLFQPYTVGKANVTAAVGGYKSQTAVAIGTGYRYNKHVATKAGVAFTQGGAAYNVGVNFEW